MSKELITVTESDLSMLDYNVMNRQQLNQILKATPRKYVKSRPAKGGGTWNYVDGGYIKKCLNLMFGWDWDFQIISKEVICNEVVVHGRLTCRCGDKIIIKEQFGNKEILYKKGTEIPLSIGNDFKSASTDALKKCATEIGIAMDVYNPEDFTPVKVEADKNLTDYSDEHGED